MFVDVVTGELFLQTHETLQQKDFREEDKKIISIYEVKTMIESENNQTQIIGTEIVTKLAIFLHKISKEGKIPKLIKTKSGIIHRSLIIDKVIA